MLANGFKCEYLNNNHMKTPKILLSGDFKKINEWKKINGRKIGGRKEQITD